MDGKVLIFDIQKFSVHDGPGIRTIVFFKGCPIRCQWCANPESQSFAPDLLFYPSKCIGCKRCISACKQGSFKLGEAGEIVFDRSKCIACCECTKTCYAESLKKSGDWMTVEEIMNEVDKDMVFYKNSGGGITFSGGEAMCFPKEVKVLAEYYKKQGVSTAIETCGYAKWESFKEVLPYLDLVMFDLKIIEDNKHIKYTGGSNNIILENIKKISQKTETVIRIPIIPNINDTVDDIEAFGEFINQLKNHIKTIHLLPYHNFGSGKYQALGKKYLLEKLEPPTNENMERIKMRFEEFGFNIVIGG